MKLTPRANQLSTSEMDTLALTSMHRLLETKPQRKSLAASSFKRMDITRANTTLQIVSRRNSMGKTLQRISYRTKLNQETITPTLKDVGNKTAYFDKYLSDASVLDNYKTMSHIGKGSFSTVSLAVEKETGRKCAMKTYEKIDAMEYYRLDSIKRELKHLAMLDHPHVVKLLHVVKDKKKLQILMENGGKQSLSGLLRKNKRFGEKSAKFYMKQLFQAIAYCHERGVSHRDLKPENILVDDEGHVTLIDFGFSASSVSKLSTYCGTPPFMCPEITKKIPYSGAAADIWALGIIAYQLVTGTLPFRATNEAELFRLIQQGKYPMKEGVSKGLKVLLDKMLCVEPCNRISAAGLLSEAWAK